MSPKRTTLYARGENMSIDDIVKMLEHQDALTEALKRVGKDKETRPDQSKISIHILRFNPKEYLGTGAPILLDNWHREMENILNLYSKDIGILVTQNTSAQNVERKCGFKKGKRKKRLYIYDREEEVENRKKAIRLKFIRYNQDLLRVDNYNNLRRAVERGDIEPSSAGSRLIVSSSLVGGGPYMRVNYLDTMTICRWFGYPDLFITFSCKPKWPEITRFVRNRGLNPEDRPDILSRVFKIKLEELMIDLKERHIFGSVRAKRGLPHAHILLFLHREDKFPEAADIDKIISAEIPNPVENPVLHAVVCTHMIHGPGGTAKPRSPCMVGSTCSKHFPKRCTERTTIGEDGYPIYKRSKIGKTIYKDQVALDNGSVVLYNPYLLLKYRAHINVEWCNQSKAIKYLSACEAVWRIFAFNIHYRTPAVERLQFHLLGEQSVVFDDEDPIDEVLEKSSMGVSKFLSWMKINSSEEEELQIAKDLLYCQFPTKFVWNKDQREWTLRKQNFKIGRLQHVPPTYGELYFMRTMLNHVKGPKSYEDIRRVNGTLYDTYREACYAYGLIGDDKEYIDAIKEASEWASGFYLRNLFATLLLSGTLSMRRRVWEATWSLLADDILHRQRNILQNRGLELTDEELKNYALIDIEASLQLNGSSLARFEGMPLPDTSSTTHHANTMVMDELSYDKESLQAEHAFQLSSMTDEQTTVYNEIMEAIASNQGGVFFVYGYGRTGKTFIWRTLCAALRSKGEIVLPVASSGIAATLIPGGRTAHARLGIPINLTENSTCPRIKPGSDLAELLIRAKLIIWDEAPMTHKHGFEAVDRSLKDVMRVVDPRNATLPFGEKVVVFGGDFRQTLPVVSKGSRADVVHASLCSSYLWGSCAYID
ncbi:uncharacterized protein LOC141629809 [Silene latifolia]|uniref:uncharacterized protein LOC141629809 n=1 Tax=Silene latifolia TaxID=37657 RepID=UPI003D783DCF